MDITKDLVTLAKMREDWRGCTRSGAEEVRFLLDRVMGQMRRVKAGDDDAVDTQGPQDHVEHEVGVRG